MRSIHRAVIAGATAASLVMGVVSVATAQTTPTGETETTTVTTTTTTETAPETSAPETSTPATTEPTTTTTPPKDEKEFDVNSLSSKLASKLDLHPEQPANGSRLWGSDGAQDRQNEPKWAQYMRVVTILGVVGSFLGLVVFPAYNFLVFNHLIPGISPR